MLKLIFLFLIVIVLSINATCCFILKKNKSALAHTLITLNNSAVFTFICYFLSLIKFSDRISLFFVGAYNVSIHWLLIFFLDYLFVFTDMSFSYPKITLFRRIVRSVAVVDIISFMLNVFTGHAMTISANIEKGVFISWKPEYNIGFYVHLFVCYVLVAIIIYGLLKKYIKTNTIYRRRYAHILVEFTFIVLVNACFIFTKAKLDFSILMFVFFTISSVYFSMYSFPKDIEIKLHSLITDNIKSAIFCFDRKRNCIYENKAAKKLFRRYEIFTELNSLLLENKKFVLRNSNVEVLGETLIVEEEFHVIEDQNENLLGYFIKCNDITSEIKKLSNERYKSTHDMLTGLYNRQNFFIEAEKIIRSDPNTPRYLISTNIKNFKLINDLFGSTYGDELLKKQAEYIASEKFSDVVAGRISGDKFALIMKKSDFSAARVARHIEGIKNFMSNLNYRYHIYLGLYEIADPFESVNSMYDKATLAAKEIKDDYSQIIAYYNTALLDHLVEENGIINEFEVALAENQFVMYLQPQISSTTEKVLGAEALVRWIHPKKGIIYPAYFIETLEKTGNLYKLDRYVWECAAKKLAEWKSKGIDFHIAVNISAKDFYHLDLYAVMTGLVEQYGISPKTLKLEITETVLMHDIALHTKVLEKLQAYGFCIEMDDFGSGYSSLNMLKNIKMDILKIDMAFLYHEKNSERSKKILSSIIKMARQLGMQVITEGVESSDYAEFLKSIGCDIFQGFLYSRPVSIEDFEKRYLEG